MRNCCGSLAMLALLGCLTACTDEEIYDTTSDARLKQCEALQEPDRTDCRQRADMPFNNYDKLRKEEIEGKDTKLEVKEPKEAKPAQ